MKINEHLLLTIVIPVYNTNPELLKRALLSIPIDERIGCIVYNDGSDKFNYEDIIKHWMENDFRFDNEIIKSNFSFVNSIENHGLGATRNKAIREVGSKYIFFLDSDDTIDTNSMINIVNSDYFNNEFLNVSLINGGINLIRENSIISETLNKFESVYKMIPYFTTWNIYNTKFLRSNNIYYDESKRTYEDIEFSVKVYSMMNSKNWISQSTEFPIYNYYLVGESLTRVIDRDKCKKLSEDLNHWIEVIKSYAKWYYSENNDDYKVPKEFFINRLRFESIKLMGLKLNSLGLSSEFDKYLDILKPYKSVI